VSTSSTRGSATPFSATSSGSLKDPPVLGDRGARGAQAEAEACRDCAVPVEVRILPAASESDVLAAVAQAAEADRDQSQTLAPDSAFAVDRRIDRAQAPGRRNAGSSPVRTARCAVVQRQDATTSRLTWTLKRAGVCSGTASQDPGAGYALGSARVHQAIVFIKNAAPAPTVTPRQHNRPVRSSSPIYRGHPPRPGHRRPKAYPALVRTGAPCPVRSSLCLPGSPMPFVLRAGRCRGAR
jgi:hypothetical protein